MESLYLVLVGQSVRIPQILIFLTAIMTVGCVNLDKPENVAACATANNCSNNPNPQPGLDANYDVKEPGPDSPSYADKPGAKADLDADSPLLDASVYEVELGTDGRDVTGMDGKETGSVSDVPPAEAGSDLGPDTSSSECAPDQAPDLRPDLKPDLSLDLTPDRTLDLTPDASTLVSGLLVYYKFESATGTTLQDSSGNGYNGTLAGSGYTFPAGKVGKALALTKAGQGYVSVPPAAFANATNITVAVWVNVTTAQNWQRVLDTGINAKLATNTSTGTRYMNLVPKNDGANLLFAISKDGHSNEQVLSAAALATSTWRHVAVVLSAGQGTLYVDGVAQASSAIVLRPTDLGTIDYAFLGKSQFTSDPYFDGQLDEFRVYSRALSVTEIQALFQFAGP